MSMEALGGTFNIVWFTLYDNLQRQRQACHISLNKFQISFRFWGCQGLPFWVWVCSKLVAWQCFCSWIQILHDISTCCNEAANAFSSGQIRYTGQKNLQHFEWTLIIRCDTDTCPETTTSYKLRTCCHKKHRHHVSTWLKKMNLYKML